MQFPPSDTSSSAFHYVVPMPMPAPQLFLVPTSQQARVSRFQHSPTATIIKVSFLIALILWAIFWVSVPFFLIDESRKSKASKEDEEYSPEGIAILVSYFLCQFLGYSSTLYAAIMVGRKEPNCIGCLACVSLPMLLVLAGLDLFFLTFVPCRLIEVPLLLLTGHTILVIESILFLCNLSEIYQDNDVHPGNVASMQVGILSN